MSNSQNEKINFKSLIQWCPQAFVFADMEGNVQFANPAAHRLYGYDEGELLGKNVDIFNSHLTHNTEEIVEAIKEDGSWEGELIQRKKDDSIFFAELSVNLVFVDGQPTGLCSYSRDITDKKEAEKKVLEQRELLASSSKLSTIGEMAAGIAHELNNPLAIISTKVQLLNKLIEKGKLEKVKIEGELSDVKDTCDRISKIILGLKAISRDGSLDPKTNVNISEVFSDSLNLCQERFKINSIDFRADTKKSEDSYVLGRGGQLSQVVLNLLNNAFDAVQNVDEKLIELSSSLNEDKLLIEIQDSGEGIDLELREKILQPFFTTKDPGKGTGLGLSISRRIIEDHGGKLYLKDQKKTCFVIELPLVD